MTLVAIAAGVLVIGDKSVYGTHFQKVGELTAEDIETVKQLLDETVPFCLSWVKEWIKMFIG